jgi:hypothetical protein
MVPILSHLYSVHVLMSCLFKIDLRLGLRNSSSPSHLLTTVLYAFLILSMCATYATHLFLVHLVHLITLIIFV